MRKEKGRARWEKQILQIKMLREVLTKNVYLGFLRSSSQEKRLLTKEIPTMHLEGELDG